MTKSDKVRGGWMRLAQLYERLGLDEEGLKIGLNAGQIERLHRAGEVFYRVRGAAGIEGLDPSGDTPNEGWRAALTAFKSRSDGRFLSRKRQPSPPADFSSEERATHDAEEPARAEAEPILRTWARFPGYFPPEFTTAEEPSV